MRALFVCLLVVSVVGSVAQDTSRIGAGIYADPSNFFDAFIAHRQADVLIGGDFAGGTFPDLTDEYEAAYIAAGASSTEIVIAPSNGPIPFPDPLDASDYPVVVVLTADNWWSAPNNFQTEDANALIAYCETGGNVLVVGQDLLYGYKPSWGTPNDGFFDDYIGLSYVSQDVFWNIPSTTWKGYGPLDGLSGTGVASAVFTSNNFYCDDLTPALRADVLVTGEPDYNYTFGIYNDTGSNLTAFSTFELASDTTNFDDIIAALYDWMSGPPDETPPTITNTYPHDEDYPCGVPVDTWTGCHWEDGDPAENKGIDVDSSTFELFDSNMDPVDGTLNIDDTDLFDVVVDFEPDGDLTEGETYTVDTVTYDKAGNGPVEETWTFTTGFVSIAPASLGTIKAGYAE